MQKGLYKINDESGNYCYFIMDILKVYTICDKSGNYKVNFKGQTNHLSTLTLKWSGCISLVSSSNIHVVYNGSLPFCKCLSNIKMHFVLYYII